MDLKRNPTLSYFWKRRKCRHCNKLLTEEKIEYEDIVTIKEYDHKRYCNHKCLKADLQSLGFDGAVHAVHQKFGTDHPVTRQIQSMRSELKNLRKVTDWDDHKLIEDEWFYRNLKKAEKCL
jgi:transcriptional regulator NrdR family protein